MALTPQEAARIDQLYREDRGLPEPVTIPNIDPKAIASVLAQHEAASVERKRLEGFAGKPLAERLPGELSDLQLARVHALIADQATAEWATGRTDPKMLGTTRTGAQAKAEGDSILATLEDSFLAEQQAAIEARRAAIGQRTAAESAEAADLLAADATRRALLEGV